ERGRHRRVRVRHEREGSLRDAVGKRPHRHRPSRARGQPQRLPGRAKPLLAPPRRRLPERDAADRRRRHLHPQGRRVGAVTVRSLEHAEPIELPNGSWTRMLVTEGAIDGNRASLGYSVFTPGTELQPVKHETEEFAYVVSGAGELRLDDNAVAFTAGD